MNPHEHCHNIPESRFVEPFVTADYIQVNAFFYVLGIFFFSLSIYEFMDIVVFLNHSNFVF